MVGWPVYWYVQWCLALNQQWGSGFGTGIRGLGVGLAAGSRVFEQGEKRTSGRSLHCGFGITVHCLVLGLQDCQGLLVASCCVFLTEWGPVRFLQRESHLCIPDAYLQEGTGSCASSLSCQSMEMY